MCEPGGVGSDEQTAVVLVDTSGVILYWSAGATALFGIADPTGETLDVIVPAEFRERHWAGFHRAMTTGESRISGGRLNIPVRCGDGLTRSFPGTFTVLWDGHGRPVGATAAWSQRRGNETPFSPIAPSDLR
jgi:PAS domain-containing protein